MVLQFFNNIYFLMRKKLVLILSLLVFFTFSPRTYAIFQVRFFGGPLAETEESSVNYKKGTLFKTQLSFGNTFRFAGSFAYSQSSMGTINILQGDLGFGASFYPHYSEPVPFLQPFLNVEAVGIFKTEDETSNADPKEKTYSAALNFGVGMDINFSRSLGLIVGAEVHNFKQHRLFVGFLQGY